MTVQGAPSKKVGRRTIQFANPPVIIDTASVAGSKEGEGPLGETFDKVIADSYYGEKSWELAERKMLGEAATIALGKANLRPQDVDYFLSGDLLNQTISANFVARDMGIPFLGLYGACSTMFEGLALAGILIDGGFANYVLVAVSSHYCCAERQYRFPTEQGAQRPLYAQWTVTGAGAAVVAREGNGPRLTYATVGKVVDLGVKDPSNMGAAMAPAAVDTIVAHLQDTARAVEAYDLIVTGDLAEVGKELALRIAEQQGYDLRRNYTDCGVMIYKPEQDTHAGGSGCACSAVVLAGYLMREMAAGELKRVLAVGTGALQSITSVQQGESIPGIGHGIAIEA